MLDIKNTDIIYLGIFRWEDPYSSIAWSMAQELAKNNRVFFINHPYTIFDFIKKRKEKLFKKRTKNWLKRKFQIENPIEKLSNLKVVISPLLLPINKISNKKIYAVVSAINQHIVRKSLKDLMRQYHIKKFIYINCTDPFFSNIIPHREKPLLSIYQCIDDISQSEYMVKHGVRLEEKCISKSDCLLVTSTELKRIKGHLNDRVYILHNAADISNFNKAVYTKFERPKELKNIQKSIVGYIGNLDHLRIDYLLLKKAAQAHLDKVFCLVGPINNNYCEELGLTKMENIIFTGGKLMNETPKYLQYFNCTIIPFLKNTLTKSIYPLKINEYLAAGKQVVSTNFSEDIASFKKHIFLASSETEFIEMIGQAIAKDSKENRLEQLKIAEKNSWQNRVSDFWSIINDQI